MSDAITSELVHKMESYYWRSGETGRSVGIETRVGNRAIHVGNRSAIAETITVHQITYLQRPRNFICEFRPVFSKLVGTKEFFLDHRFLDAVGNS